METFLMNFVKEVNSMMLIEQHTNKVYELAIKLLEQYRNLISSISEDDAVLKADALNNSNEFVTNTLSKYQTKFKRQSTFKDNSLYVAPEERALGTRWEILPIKNSNLCAPQLVQSKFQYLSILATLKALFSNDNFRKTYLKFNTNKSFNDHVCTEGEYRNICCGKSFRNNALFSNEPTSIKIMLASDDFGICNPLGSKANVHKINAVYMSIRNMPEQYSSKQDNIFVVSLANADDLKTKETDFNDIWRLIMRDISVLENTGIDIGNGQIIKGSIACLTFDNLGASMALGYAEGTNTSYYCRICEAAKCVCHTLCREDESLLRTIQKYETNVQKVKNSKKVQYSETKGIKQYCILNDLKYFHMLNSPSQDPFHDLNEGAVRELLTNFFTYMIHNKIIAEKKLIQKIQYFNYGYLKRDVKPSMVLLTKANLNQNGSQIMCLLQNVPFIFYEYRDHELLEEVWKCVLALIRISQIVYSAKLTEDDVNEMERLIEAHLTLHQKCFKVHLKPKHHFLLHYGHIIRNMGPIKFLSMIRFESKHQQLKKLIAKSTNFRNITKTIAQKHQIQMQFKTDTYKDVINFGKKTKLSRNETIFLNNFQQNDLIFEIKWFEVNSYRYKKDLLIQDNGYLYKIDRCLISDAEDIYLLCYKAEIIGKSNITNSIMIRRFDTASERVLRYCDIMIKNVYETKYVCSVMHVISDDISLDYMET